MPRTKTTDNVTLNTEKDLYAVHLDDDTIVNVEASSLEEAIKKAKAKEQ